MEFLITVDIFFNISPRSGNLLSRQYSKNKSINQMDLFAKKVIYFWKKLPNQIKNSNNKKNILNWMISVKIILEGILGNLRMNYITKFHL